jgi:hypothetical protein
MKSLYSSLLAAGVFALGASVLHASAVVNVPAFAANTLATTPADGTESAGPLSLGFTANFLGTDYSSVYVNSDGTETFSAPTSASSSGVLSGAIQAEFAPFLAGIDTSASGTITYGAGSYKGLAATAQAAFGVDYNNVGYDDGESNKTNTFQVILESRADIAAGDFDVYFNYNQVQWDTSDSAGGTNGVFDGNSLSQAARAGFTDGSGNAGEYYELPGSGVNSALLDGGPDSLVADTAPSANGANGANTWTLVNDGTAGSYLFEFRGPSATVVPLPPAIWSGLAMFGLLGAGALVANRRRARA